MYELTVTSSALQIVLKHALKGHVKRAVSLNLEIDALSDVQGDWLQRISIA